MQNYNLKAIKNQAGMTLIELTVVLLVLIGLAGLTLPYVSGFISKTHNSTSADSGSNLFTALAMYNNQFNGIPNNLNTLIDASSQAPSLYLDNTAANATNVAAAVAAGAATPFVGTPTNFAAFTPITGSLANANASLAAANVTLVAQLPYGTVSTNPDGTITNTVSATFSPEKLNVSLGVTTPLVSDIKSGLNYTTTNYIGGQNTSISGVLGYNVPSGHSLIVMGVGAGNSAVGKSLASVPVHFGDKGSLQPQLTYSRFLAAIDVDSAAGTAPAKIVGIVHAPDFGDKWESLYSSIASYYQS